MRLAAQPTGSPLRHNCCFAHMKLATNLVFHQRSKHIRKKYHSLRDRVAEGLIELCKVDTGLNVADMFTKNVGVGMLKICKGLVGMVKSG